MRLILAFALKTRRHVALMAFTFLAMMFMTVASQLEIVTIGILTKKSISFFELFGNVEGDKLHESTTITREQLEKRWEELDMEKKGYIEPTDTNKFLKNINRQGLVDRAITTVERIFPLSNNIYNLAIMITVVGLLKAFTLFCHRFSTQLIAIKISRDLRYSYFEHIQTLPMSFYQKHDIGGLSARVVSDAAAIAEGINAALVNYLQTPFTVVTTMTLCFFLSWKLSLLVFLGIPAIIYPIMLIARKVKKISKQLQKNQEHFASVLIDYLAGVQTVKMFSMEDYSMKKYSEQNTRMAQLEKKSARYGVAARPIVHSIGMLFLSSALIFGLYVLHMSIADIFVYAGFLMVFYEPIKKFAEENTVIQRGAAAAERMGEVLQIKPDIQDEPNAEELKTVHKIEVDDIWFKYQDEWVIKGLSFEVNEGETVAIVGPTGSGKSTFVQLLPRLYEAQKGEIRINGMPLSTYSQSSLRSNMAFVPQKPFLFQDTIIQNIAYGSSYTMEEIELAAKQAHAAEFIEELPKKYEHELAEGGKDLSGGQQQRLAIARALMKKAPLLVMDEATSSLDSISERYIKNAIKGLHGKMTQIIIAHRLTTIEDADKIIYLEDGQKVAEGTKEELMIICPQFALMWNTMINKELATV